MFSCKAFTTLIWMLGARRANIPSHSAPTASQMGRGHRERGRWIQVYVVALGHGISPPPLPMDLHRPVKFF